MELKQGYKQTEVGIIPEEWDVIELKSVVTDMLQGVNTAIDKPEYVSCGIPMLKANNIIDQEVLFDGADHISAKTYARYSGRFRLKKNDFLFSNIGARLGTGSLLKTDIECSFAWNVMRIVPNTKKIVPQYLASTINSPRISQGIRNNQSGSGMGFVPKGILGKVLFSLPPTLSEQQSIATALSDADTYIESLEKLIAKKRAIKKGVMQELLTGKRRLPGFSGEWEIKKLGEISKIQRGASPRPIDSPIWFDDNSSIGWVRISDVTRSGMFLNETAQRLSPLGVKHSRPVASGSLIMSICATVGRPMITKMDVCIHDGFVVFDHLQLEQSFLYYVLKWIEPEWSKHGQTGSQMNLNTGLINGTSIYLPKSSEQTAIANVLNDIDTDITAHEAKLSKARLIKQGMMQELLTGRIRLI